MHACLQMKTDSVLKETGEQKFVKNVREHKSPPSPPHHLDQVKRAGVESIVFVGVLVVIVVRSTLSRASPNPRTRNTFP